ncbi:MAG: hypothetical protein NWF00_10880 [Candidatus Bathyarchaeota archaeon]|nr:hypothetical protein [Candidatus Bathyarchaeota archaeon]
MQSVNLTDEQAEELCDQIGRMLTEQLDSEEVSDRINDVVSDYLELNDIDADADELAQKFSWSVKVELTQ